MDLPLDPVDFRIVGHDPRRQLTPAFRNRALR
jgi:hypothetical protein